MKTVTNELKEQQDALKTNTELNLKLNSDLRETRRQHKAFVVDIQRQVNGLNIGHGPGQGVEGPSELMELREKLVSVTTK